MRRTLTAGAVLLAALAPAACVPLDETTATTATTTTLATTTVYVPPPTTAPPVTVDDDTIARLALEMTWDKLSASDRAGICDGVDLFGLDTAAQLVVNGADGEFTTAQVEAWLLEKC